MTVTIMNNSLAPIREDNEKLRRQSRDPSAYPYIQQIRTMLPRYPNLKRLHKVMVSEIESGCTEDSRIAVIEIQSDVSQREFKSTYDLECYLHGESPVHNEACKRRLYLLEGMAPDYVELLGLHFGIDPYVFAEQLLKGGTREGATPILPSRRDPERYFMMQYIEARHFGEGMDDLGARCIYQDRKIWANKINSKFDGVGHVHRIASFWSRENPDGGFDALLLLDPPVGDDIRIGKGNAKSHKKCPSTLHHGGYVDFSPYPAKCSPCSPPPGPTRESPYDDILFYYRQTSLFPDLHARIVDGTITPSMSAYFLKKIVASAWHPLIVYFDVILDRLEYALARSNVEGLTGAANHWSDVEYWHRRCSKSCDQLEQTLFNLGVGPIMKHGIAIPQHRSLASSNSNISNNTHTHTIAAVQPSLSPSPPISIPSPNDSCADDFLTLHAHMLALKKRSQRLGGSLTSLIGIIESKRSSEEAHSIKTLTLLGMLFVPLSFISGLFSMTDAFAPGGSEFWIYFAVSLPLVLVVFMVAFMPQVGERLRIRKRRIKAYLEASYENRGHAVQPDVEKGEGSWVKKTFTGLSQRAGTMRTTSTVDGASVPGRVKRAWTELSRTNTGDKVEVGKRVKRAWTGLSSRKDTF